jgi:LCP family protein required for cell wall assembly
MSVTRAPRRARSRKRTILTAVAIVLIGLTAVGGVYAWRMVDAIVHAEKSAVVPLPPSDTEWSWEAPGAPTATVTPTGSTDAGGPVLTSTPLDVRAEDPSAQPSATLQATGNPGQLPTQDDPSRGSVVQDLFGASIGSDDPTRSELWGGLTDINVMLLGVDKRPNGGDQNADVIIIAHVDLIDRKVSAVSIPRDLLVEIPGVGPDKINTAYNYGVQADPASRIAGVVKMRDTIESVFQVPIHGYIMVDFDGFTEVIDEMGGVTVNVPEKLVDEEYPTDEFGTEVLIFEAGVQTMDGERALKYVRTRHQDSDDGRRERQLQVLRALFDQAKSFGSVSNALDIITALGDSVQTSFYIDQQIALAQIGYDMEDPDIRLVTLTEPLIWGGTTETGAWVYFSELSDVRAWVHEALSTDNFVTFASTPALTSPSPVALP